MTNFTQFEIFKRSGLHGEWWGRSVLSLVKFTLHTNISLYHVDENSRTEHAEGNMICFLRLLLAAKLLPSQTLECYVSFSPCSSCSEKLIAFRREAKESHGVELTWKIIFPSLYRIRRPSCERAHHKHLVNAEDHCRNVRGLRNLCEDGAILRTVCEKDWRDLAHKLGVAFTYEGSARQVEDRQLCKDFQELGFFSDGRFSKALKNIYVLILNIEVIICD